MEKGSLSFRSRATVIWAVSFFAIAQLAALGWAHFHPGGSRSPASLIPGSRFARSLTRPPSIEESILTWQLRRLGKGMGQVDFLFLGDSSCLMGIIPSTVEKTTGRSAYDLGTVAWLGTQGNADLLEYYLAHSPPPKRIIYHVSTGVLDMSAASIEKVGLLRALRRWMAQGDKESGVGALSWLPLARFSGIFETVLQDEVYRWNKAAFLRAARNQYPSDEEMGREIALEKGHIDEASNTAKLSIPNYVTHPHLVDDARAGLFRILEISAKKSIPLSIVLNPVPESARKPETEVAYHALQIELQEILSAYPRASIKLPLLRYYPDDSFANSIHLSRAGAETNSVEVALWIQSR